MRAADGLTAAHGRAAEDPLDRIVLQPDHESLGLAVPDGGQGPHEVRTVEATLVTGIAMPDHDQHAILRVQVACRSVVGQPLERVTQPVGIVHRGPRLICLGPADPRRRPAGVIIHMGWN